MRLDADGLKNRARWSGAALVATRCRIIECINRWLFHLESTRHVPAGPYVGVLPSR